jgi:hypothetical protein
LRSGRTFTLFAFKASEGKLMPENKPRAAKREGSAPECLSKSLTQESHLDEKVRSAETIERE